MVFHGHLFWVVCVEYINKLVNKHWLATGQSFVICGLFWCGPIAGNYWTGYLHDTSGMKISEIFLLNAGIVALVVVSIILFMKNQK